QYSKLGGMVLIDIHAHILPGFDDGAQTIEESIEMAKQAVDEGITTIVGTPHIYDILTGPGREEILRRTEELNLALAERGINCQVLPGGEIHVSADLPERLKRGEVITLGDGGKYMLLELPLQQLPAFTEQVIYELNLAGVRPIIAHPERNMEIMQKPELLERLIHLGALTQVSSGSLLGNFGKQVSKVSHYLLTHGLLHIIASDGHSPRRRRVKMAAAAQRVKEILGEKAAIRMTKVRPESILRGENVEIPKIKRSNLIQLLQYCVSLALAHLN
ncbi:MAG TPA: hypothetical protein PLE68_10615, partial [Bacillota bacterium]|nr:hypothetical protein [Bacillota bacterium]